MEMRFAERCPECGSQRLIHDYETAETICMKCGFVFPQLKMDRGPDWRAYTPKERASRSRTGAPASLLVHDKGLSTTIGWNYDAFGRRIPLAARFQMNRLRKWQIHSRVHSAIERNLVQAIQELNRLSDFNKLNIPKPIKEQALFIYRKALKKGLVRGRSIVGVIAAALFVACRLTKTPRTLQEVAKASLVSKKEVARYYRFLLKELDIKMPVASPLMGISKIAEITGISGETQGIAIKILHKAQRKHLTSGKDPNGIAAALLYIACKQNGEWVGQKNLAEAADVTEVTIRNRYKELERELGLKFPDHKDRF